MNHDQSAGNSAAHALLKVLNDHGVDRVYLVPGESFLGVLDALSDFPQIDVVNCRHEAGAGFMACADGRLRQIPGVLLVSRGPGASHAAIAIHTAEQDAIPLIMIVGQIPKADLRKRAFQEIDYRVMFGDIAKWVEEVTDPAQLAAACWKAIRIATSGRPGPVVLVVPEDMQQPEVDQPYWQSSPPLPTLLRQEDARRLAEMLRNAKRPLIVAGGYLDRDRGREVLIEFAERYQCPVVLAFRQQDLFPHKHPLYAGDLGLANPKSQIECFDQADLIVALGTLLDDITTQGYRFPRWPQPQQALVHVYPDHAVVGQHFAAQWPIVADPIDIMSQLIDCEPAAIQTGERKAWQQALLEHRKQWAAWPDSRSYADGLAFVEVIKSLEHRAAPDWVLCLDAGTFAAPVYRHWRFAPPQRLLAPLVGAMGFGTPAALVAAMRMPDRPVICLLGDGCFQMSGQEMVLAAERQLPILFIVANNASYASIRIHQDRHYPGRHRGTSLVNPDFVALMKGYGIDAEAVETLPDFEACLDRVLTRWQQAPHERLAFGIEVKTSLLASLPGSHHA
ncbi:MAG: thiamine pyrophosphate-dependent enzyme [Burkholderiaceae bacterium]